MTNTGTAATSRSSTRSKLPASLPSTSWPSVRRLMSNSSSVRRSFSDVTATVLVIAAASIASASCRGASTLRSVAPNRAVSPAVVTAWVPVTTSQHVATMPRSMPQ